MNMHTKMSSKGHVVIPKAMRDRMGLQPGVDFEVVQRGRNVLLRRATASKNPIDWDTFRARMPKYTGPPMTIEQISSVSEEALREHYLKNPV